MQIEITKEKSTITIEINGILDKNNYSILEKKLNVLTNKIKKCIFDLKYLKAIDNKGIETILEFQKVMNYKGTMEIINTTKSVYNYIKSTNYDYFLDIK